MTLRRPDGNKFYQTPNYPDVPHAEWKARIDKAQRLMSENGVDCLVLWSKPNIRYFFGYQNTHWLLPSIQSAVGIIPAKGESHIIVPDFFRGNAECLCWTRNIWEQPNPHQPKSERELPVEVANVIKELGYGNKRIGWESGPLGCMSIPRPPNDIFAFVNALHDAKFVDGDKIIWGCRMIKSPLEIDRIQTAVKSMAAVELAIVEEFRPGMSEIDISIIIQRKAAELGNGFIGDSIGLQGPIRAALDKEMMADMGVHEGAMVDIANHILFDMFFQYKGYCPDSGRVFQVGPLTERILANYDLIWKCEDAAEAAIKPGAKANEVWKAMYSPMEAAGLEPLDMGGHGTGLDTHEPPSIDAWNDMEIKEGMVLSIEPWVYRSLRFNGGEGKFGIQDQFVVTDKGCEKISALRRDLIQVSNPITK